MLAEDFTLVCPECEQYQFLDTEAQLSFLQSWACGATPILRCDSCCDRVEISKHEQVPILINLVLSIYQKGTK